MALTFLPHSLCIDGVLPPTGLCHPGQICMHGIFQCFFLNSCDHPLTFYFMVENIQQQRVPLKAQTSITHWYLLVKGKYTYIHEQNIPRETG